MVCYYHFNQPAIGICKYCQRGLCRDCAVLVDDSLACKDRHEDKVYALNLLSERGILNAQRIGASYVRNAIFYLLVGVLFSGFGLLQYRFLGLEAVFFILIGVFLLYAAVANFAESRRYK
jgi:sulfite exporter TauE/SafE